MGAAGQWTVFALGAALSLGTSGLLVSRLERLGERLGLREAMLGMLAALAGDAPEISAAVSALVRGQHSVGVGVVLGSNLFNLAALLGLASIVAGGIKFHRRVVTFEGTVAFSMAAISVVVVLGHLSPLAGLILALVFLLPYLAASGMRPASLRRLPVPRAVLAWLSDALVEEEAELSEAIRPRAGGIADAIVAVVALVVVVGASVAMEHAATSLGARYGIASIVTGGIVLAAVTSLPNAVAAIYLATRGRGAATLSVALNSNTLNVTAGLLVPAAIVGLGSLSGGEGWLSGWYVGLTVLVLLLAFAGRGLRPPAGALIIAAYATFVVTLVLK